MLRAEKSRISQKLNSNLKKYPYVVAIQRDIRMRKSHSFNLTIRVSYSV